MSFFSTTSMLKRIVNRLHYEGLGCVAVLVLLQLPLEPRLSLVGSDRLESKASFAEDDAEFVFELSAGGDLQGGG